MRLLVGLVMAGLLGGCLGFSAGPPDTSSQSELGRDAIEYCGKTPNTDDMLECLREKQDSWRGEPVGEKIKFPERL